MNNPNPPRSYRRRQDSMPLEECLTRKSVSPVLPKPPTRPRRGPSLGLRWGVIALAAITGMGSGVGVMALFMPQRSTSSTPTVASEPKTVVIPPHPEVLIPVKDNRTLIASVLNEGGKQDPFATPPQAVQQFPVLPPAPLPTSPTLQSAQGQPTTQILPPPAAIAAMMPRHQMIQDLPTPQAAIQNLPAPQTATPSLLDTPTAPQQSVSLSVTTNKATLMDTPDLNVATLPEVNQGSETLGLKLMGVASAGENRIALIRTSPDTTPFSASVGDVVGGWRVKAIDDSQVVIIQGDQQQILKIGG